MGFKPVIISHDSVVFSISQALGLFCKQSRRDVDLRTVWWLRFGLFLILSSLLGFQLYLLLRSIFFNTDENVASLVYRFYAITALTLSLSSFTSHFRSLMKGRFKFTRSREQLKNQTLYVAISIHMIFSAVKLVGLAAILIITKRENVIGFITFCSYFIQSILAFFHLFIICQMHVMTLMLADTTKKITLITSLRKKLNKLDEILDLFASVNKFYEGQIYFHFTNEFIKIVNCGYYSAYYVFVMPDLVRTYRYYAWNLVVNISVLLESMCPIILPISATEKLNQAIDAFYDELFRITRANERLCANKKLCLYLTLRRTVNFTACGFFSLGYPLVTSIIAAATTYLVILVQFSMPK